MNAYELLGVTLKAELDEIKQAYRRLAKGLHPDVNAGDSDAAERFKAVTAAYNLLADARKRVEYDRTQRQRDPKTAPEDWEKGGAWFDFEIDETTGERIIDLYGDVAGRRLGRTTQYQDPSQAAAPVAYNAAQYAQIVERLNNVWTLQGRFAFVF